MSLPRDDAHPPQAGTDIATNAALEQRPDAEAVTPPQQSESWLVHLPSATLLAGLAALSLAFDWPDWVLFLVGLPGAVLLNVGTRRWLSRAR